MLPINKNDIRKLHRKCWTRRHRHSESAETLHGEREFFLSEGRKDKWAFKEEKKPFKERIVWKKETKATVPIVTEKDFSIEGQFFELAKKWKRETAGYALIAKKITNNYYLSIIGLGVSYGVPIIKLILQDLQNGPEHWNYALKKITRKNLVPKEDIYDLMKIREIWLAWGKKNKLI